MATSEATGLATRARRLAAFAREASGAQEAVQNEARTRTALDGLASRVAGLDSQVAVWEALLSVGVPLPPPGDLVREAEDLRAFIAANGRPTPERLRGAARRIQSRTDELASECLGPWQEWAQRQLSQVDAAKVPLVPQPQQSQVAQRLASLSADAKNPPTAASVRAFANSVSLVVETLDGITTSSAAEASGLAKLAHGTGVALSEFTAEELRALHANADLAPQIQLRRR